MRTRLGGLGSRLLKAPAPDAGWDHPIEARRLLVLRWVLAVGQAATILITWGLWTTHTDPPTLPALPLPSLDVRVPLLLSLAFFLRYPLAGAIAHAALLALSFGMDQTRLQPEVVSMALLMFATTGHRALVLIGRTHLVTLWFWAGLAKLLSDSFYGYPARWMFEGLPLPSVFGGLGVHFGAVVIILEMGAGILAVPVRTRRISVAFAIAVHLGALLSIGPLGHNWNHAIWPWNLVLPVAAIVLIGSWTEGAATELRRAAWPTRVAVGFIVLFPAGYYVGAADAYLSHHLYSDDTPTAVVCSGPRDCSREPMRAPLYSLRAPLPPEHRLLRALFDKTCEPGQTLLIRDPRRWYAADDWEDRRRCPTGRSD